ncbi:hypothetical protein NGM36_01695 [Streptomyces mutabilis]|uniref:hypothetical protein n=1 Tax=Streptomyces mutabilis TaxID=67332 RepID=UPI0022BA21EE|nr:hypothetical protein [Streptomyces mutabilis]MCZ9348530.1 hypothetical protein [Streptomyces mutabilis]
MTICARCDKPIKGEPERIAGGSATGASEVEVHPGYCKPAPRQTYPAGRGR